MAAIDTVVTGMDSASQWLNVIANNLANLNTVGYKARKITFEDILSQTLQGGTAPSGASGGRNPVQVGLGVQVGAVMPQFTQGSIEETGVPTDVAIQGPGFLVLQRGASMVFSRDGALAVDAAGNLVQASTGASVMGWLAASGVITPSGTPSPISLNAGRVLPPVATSTASLVGNLQAGSTSSQTLLVTFYDALGTPITTQFTFTEVAPGLWTWAATLPSGGGTIPGATGTYSAGSPFAGTPTIPAGSNLGGGATYQIVLDPTGAAEILDGATVVARAPGAAGAAAGSTVTFYNVQTPTQVAMVATVGPAPLPPAPASGTTSLGSVTVTSGGTGMLTFGSTGTLVSQTGGPISITPTDGSAPMAVAPDFSRVTQYASPTSVALAAQNGSPAGALVAFSVGADGIITGSYSNGLQQPIAQIALATFANPQGLVALGENQWQVGPNSGAPQIAPPSSSGGGTLAGGALEQSTVDMSEQLTEVIQAQSAFQAQAKVITAIQALNQSAIQMVA
jgi:flagellar hook protein FlgE